jgi:hypothetical protein
VSDPFTIPYVSRWNTPPPPPCPDCLLFGHAERLQRLITRNGVSQITAFCTRCEYVSTILPHGQFTPAQIEDIPIFKDNRCLDCYGDGCGTCVSSPCEKCGSYRQVETHHWAPRYLFGNEAWEWPTSLLCRECHRRWHATVTPRMAERKAS